MEINILYSMFDRKINFHQMESFRIQERDSGNVDYHAKRINELQETYSQLKNYITNGSNDGCDFEIFCDINISMVQK